MTDEDSQPKPPRERSPSFPFIPLKTAMGRLQEFKDKFGRQPAPADRVYLAWGYKGDTSQAQQTLAALKSFGLMEYQGSGPKRLTSVSALARTYLRANQEHIKQDILRKAATTPTWIARMWGKWGASRHPDEVCLDELVLDHKFNENTAPRFLSVYDQTIAYAGLSDSDKIEENDDDAGEGEDDLGKQKHGKSGAGGFGKKKVKLEMNERELSAGLLSKSASFRLIVSGEIGAKEIERLIAKLEVDKEIMADQDDDGENQ